MKRIAIVNTSYNFCGVDSYVLNILQLFSDQVQFFLFVRKNSDFERIVKEKFNYAIVKHISKNILFSIHNFYLELKRHKIDIVHIQTAADYILSLAVYFLCNQSKVVNLIFTRHNSYNLKWFPNYIFLKICNTVICPSIYVANKLISKYSFIKRKCNVVYNSINYLHSGLENKELNNHDNNKYHIPLKVGFIGRITPKKGLHLLLKAVSEIMKKTKVNIQVKVAGDIIEKKYKTDINLLIKDLNLENTIQMIGFAKNKSLFYDSIDFVVIPSLIMLEEAFGLTALEAMAYGKAVICFPSGALSELVLDGYNGLVCKDDSVESLTESLILLIKEPELIRIYGENGRQYFKDKFTAEQYYSIMKSIYTI